MEKVIDDIYTYLSIRNIIQQDLWRRMEKNPSFSLRAYSKMLEISPGYLSNFLNGKKNISPTKLEEILVQLGFDNNEILYCKDVLRYESLRDKGQRDIELEESIKKSYSFVVTTELNPFSVMLDSPQHTILSVFGSMGFDKESLFEQFSKLWDNLDDFEKALSDLISDGHLKLEDGKVYSASDNNIITDSDIRVMKNNKEVSHMIHQNIINHGNYDDFHKSNSLKFAIGRDQIETANAIIKKCLHDLMRLTKGTENSSECLMVYSQEFIILDLKK